MAQFVLSNQGKNKLVHDNYLYTLSKRTLDDEYSIWVCEKRTTCKGRIWTRANTNEYVKTVTAHNHAAQAARSEAVQVVNNAKERARTTVETPQEIVGNVVTGIHTNVAALLPRKDSLKQTVHNVRQDQNLPALPRDVENLVIPQSHQEIVIHGVAQQFLMYDSGQQLLPSRMLVFATRHTLQLLAQNVEWFADSTFSTVPNLFGQLYMIHAMVNNSIVPLVYALLPNKTQATYTKLLQELQNLQVGLQPQYVMLDFEQAAIRAFQAEFPGVQITGCFFHLAQSVWRHVQNEGLKERYTNDHEFARWIRMIPALAFVDPNQVVGAFEDLVDDGDFPPDAMPIAHYFEDNYIGRIMHPRGRQAPIFPMQLWNMHQRTLLGQNRTNNDVEGWHRSFQQTCGLAHLNIYKFIEALKKQHGLHQYEIAQLVAGNPGNPRNKKYQSIAHRFR